MQKSSISFVESNHSPLISFEDVFSGDILNESVVEKVNNETHTRLYLSAMNILKTLEVNINDENYDSSFYINRFVKFLKTYPIDLMVGIMKDMKNTYAKVYNVAIKNEEFVEAYFESYSSIRR